jgi:transposase-like protein
MTRIKRSFTPEERLSILQEASREGFAATCRKYSIAPSLLNRWKKQYLEKGVNGLKPASSFQDPLVKELQQENERLKKIVARMALELEVKGELLKKTPIQTIRKK